jgi:hypothetical protein
VHGGRGEHGPAHNYRTVTSYNTACSYNLRQTNGSYIVLVVDAVFCFGIKAMGHLPRLVRYWTGPLIVVWTQEAFDWVCSAQNPCINWKTHDSAFTVANVCAVVVWNAVAPPSTADHRLAKRVFGTCTPTLVYNAASEAEWLLFSDSLFDSLTLAERIYSLHGPPPPLKTIVLLDDKHMNYCDLEQQKLINGTRPRTITIGLEEEEKVEEIEEW